jgi:beta-lactamase class A
MLGKSLLVIVGILVGSAATWAGLQLVPATENNEFNEVHLGQMDFINPLVDCPARPKGASPSKAELLERVQEQIEEFKKNNKADQVAILYRDLNNGPGLGIQNREPFVAASLLKTPIMIAFFKQHSRSPDLLKREIKFDAAKDVNNARIANIKSSHPPLEDGKSYSVGELLTRMIVDSDNNSTSLLMKYFPNIDVGQSLKDMGIPVISKGDEVWITVEDYASIFRILYNATYLGAEGSNAALAILARTAFADGLEAGVDKSVPVAHKFGERDIGGLKQFHDCGIVYFPLRPYLLCIMTRGTNQQDLIEVTASLSKTFFEQVKKDSEGR